MKLTLMVTFFCLLATSCFAATCPNSNIRTYDGSCNNLQNPTWGAPGFFDQLEGYRNTAGLNLPNERTVSNRILAYPDGPLDKDYNAVQRKFGLLPDRENRNAWFVAFSQFVAHDISQNPLIFNTANISANYQVQINPVDNPNDPLYQPNINGKTGILTMASVGETLNGVFFSNNGASNWVDLSTVYGSSTEVANKLRDFQGGRLMTDATGLGLPFASVNNVPSECGAFREGVSAAGDLRSDENGHLTAVHTMFLRLHNIYANQIAASNPSWNDEQIFQAARKRLIAEYQHIVYYEFLPTMLGPVYNRYRNYKGYNRNINPTVTNTFATAAFRLVHDMVPLPALFLRSNCSYIIPPTTAGVPNQESSNCIPVFFRETGMDPLVRGALEQFAQAQDGRMVNGIRNVFLQASTPGGNLDVETSNIFRGREHGLVDFNILRTRWGKRSLYKEPGCSSGTVEDPIKCFEHITSNKTKALILKNLYKKVNLIDAYIGLVVESYRGANSMPPVATEIIIDQFDRLRRGDRLYFENESNGLFTKHEIRDIKRVTMKEWISRAYPTVAVRRNAFQVHDTCRLRV